MVQDTEIVGGWCRQGREPGRGRSHGETLKEVCLVRGYPGQGQSVSEQNLRTRNDLDVQGVPGSGA